VYFPISGQATQEFFFLSGLHSRCFSWSLDPLPFTLACWTSPLSAQEKLAAPCFFLQAKSPLTHAFNLSNCFPSLGRSTAAPTSQAKACPFPLPRHSSWLFVRIPLFLPLRLNCPNRDKSQSLIRRKGTSSPFSFVFLRVFFSPLCELSMPLFSLKKCRLISSPCLLRELRVGRWRFAVRSEGSLVSR